MNEHLDPVIHAQARLRVMATLGALAPDDEITFPRLRQLLDMTAGNLSVHLRRLEEARYVTVAKTFRLRTPVTLVRLSPAGRDAFARYIADLQDLLTTRPTAPTDPPPAPPSGPTRRPRRTAGRKEAP
jgi:DNA-binding MarR family transcriptional regulator